MFTDKVVVITGAGRGLGKDFAIFFASRGAKVVVNDNGTGKDGQGEDRAPAQDVVDLIKSRGGTAVVNFDNAVQGVKVINSAIDNFGKIDILINNAGIVIQKPFPKMSIDDYNIQMKYNVETAFACSKAAWPYFVKQKSGKIINLTSPFGLYGHSHVSPYSTSKAALIGLTKSLAIEGADYNIKVNGVAPMALSRMTEDFAPVDSKLFGPQKITPILAYLCMDDCDETGTIYEASSGWVSKVRVQRSKGAFFSQDFSLEDVIDKIQDINDFDNSSSNESEHSLVVVMNHLEAAKKKANF